MPPGLRSTKSGSWRTRADLGFCPTSANLRQNSFGVGPSTGIRRNRLASNGGSNFPQRDFRPTCPFSASRCAANRHEGSVFPRHPTNHR